MSAEDAFIAAIKAAGLAAPAKVIGDGELHRFSVTGKPKDDAGWYVFRPKNGNKVATGAFGNWRCSLSQSWCAESDESPEQRAARADEAKAALRKHEAEMARRHRDAAAAALAIWNAAAPAIAHPYLTAKGVKAYGVRMHGENLLVPMRDIDGALCSLQTISPSGVKRFLPGGRVRCCYHSIGRLGDQIIATEGYATGATLHEATGSAVAIVFTAGNLERVALALRRKYPSLDLVVAADDDWKTEGNPGLTAARRAARLVGARLAVPCFMGLDRGDRDTDFNDLARLETASELATTRAAAGA